MRRVFASMAFASIIVGVAASAQQESSAPRSQDEATRAFLDFKRSDQAARAGKIGDAENLRSLNGLVKGLGIKPPSPKMVQDSATLAALNEAMIVDIAQLLASRGFKPGDLRKAGADPGALAGSAARHIRGDATLSDEVALADTVIIGRVQRTVSTEDLGDGYLSTVEILVESSTKGGFAAGQTIKLRRRSGASGTTLLTTSSEDPFADGASVALVGSAALYLVEAGRGRPCKNCVVEQIPAFIVNGQTLVPTGGSALAGQVSDLAGV